MFSEGIRTPFLGSQTNVFGTNARLKMKRFSAAYLEDYLAYQLDILILHYENENSFIFLMQSGCRKYK